MEPKIECIENLGTFQIAEGPHWDVVTQSLYFVDIFQCSLHKYSPSTKQHTSVKLDKTISFVIPVKGFSNKFVIGLNDEISVITWDGISSKLDSIETYAKLTNTATKFNDAKADSLGHLWTGTYAVQYDVETFTPSIGCLYSLSSDKKLKVHVPNVSLSNGIAFSNDLKKLYFIDSALKRIDQFDYNVQDQTVSNRQTLFTFKKHNVEGIPDGHTIDADGNLWVAVFYGSKIIKVDTIKPETLLYTIEIPDDQVTSATFGGSNLDELYVTTAGFKFMESKDNKPVKGFIYKITNLGNKGIPGCKVKI